MELNVQTRIEDAITAVIEAAGWPAANFVVDYPTDKNAAADRFSNVALVLQKTATDAAGQPFSSPKELAEFFRTELEGKVDGVVGIDVAGPGFLNFTLDRAYFTNVLDTALAAGERWGANDSWSGKTVLVEYTSPNLFKPLHIGNLVGNIVGESVARLFTYNGATTKRFNYPSDIGLTVAKGVWGLRHTGGDPSDITTLGAAYRAGNEAYEAGGAEAEEIRAINKALYEETDPELTALREQGVATSRASLQALLTKLGTQFDHEITESAASGPGAQLVREHIGDVFVESDGAVVYEGEKVGLHTRVFLNSKGLPTYEAKDVGHFKLKNQQVSDWDCSVIVTGNEQTEYFKVVYAAIKEVFPEFVDRALEHIPTGFLTLTTGKMSSRKGTVLTGESLFAEMEQAAKEKAAETRTDDMDALVSAVAVGALKYQILKHNVGSNIVFDKEKALSFEGDSGPYLQYTHARIHSVVEKAAAAGVETSTQTAPPTAHTVEKLIERFPSVIKGALAERAPHQVTGYLTELAGAYNSFYATERIADPDDEFAPYRVALSQAVARTLERGLWTLGISAPTRM